MSTVQEVKHPREIQLAEQLTALERAALSPSIPGEVGAWVEEIIRSALALEPVLTERRDRDYRRLIAEMRKLDPELESRISPLEAESKALAAEPGRIVQEAQALLASYRGDGKDEIHLADAMLRLKQLAIDFVLRCRTEEAGLATWHDEANTRDRGPVD